MIGDPRLLENVNDGRPVCIEYLAAQQIDESAATRRRQLDGELTRLADLYRWEQVTQATYLAERRSVEVQIRELPAEPTLPSDEAIALVEQIGEVTAATDDAWRRRFVDEWFEEVRLGRGHTQERMTDMGRLELRAHLFLPVERAMVLAA